MQYQSLGLTKCLARHDSKCGVDSVHRPYHPPPGTSVQGHIHPGGLPGLLERITTVLRKTAKPDYTVLGVHHPITLLNTIPKVLVACVATDLVQLSEIHALLLSNHFGCCPGRTTLDSLHFMVKSIKDAWCKKKS